VLKDRIGDKMSSLNKKIAFFAFLMFFAPVMVLAQDTGIQDSVIVGNFDGSNIIACPGDTINIPLWAKNDQNPVTMYFPPAIDDRYIAGYLDGNVFNILNPSSSPHWEDIEFTNIFPGRPSAGFTSYPLFTMSEDMAPYDWIPFNSNGAWIKLAEFTFIISNDTSLIGTTTQIIEGRNHIINGCSFIELQSDKYHPVFIGGTIEIVSPGYEYLAGDANMANGGWPPQVIGGDLTYLLGYLRGFNPGCELGGFYCSGDVNGDCLIIGSDVTRLQNYLSGGAPPSYCPDYPPRWLTAGDLPAQAPPGWPNCEQAKAAKVIPSASSPIKLTK
jgi:hypothetical protein